jgi:hypothetical protein
MSERLVPEGAVHDHLGVKRPFRVAGPSMNIGMLNALGSRWLHRDDVLAWLSLEGNHFDSDAVRGMRRRLLEATEAP